MTTEQFEAWLVSIGGLVNGHYADRPPITTNICECGGGWLQLIHDLIEELIALGWNKEICQIKEKFGLLRFYTNGMTEPMWEALRRAERRSLQTCEVCGAPGKRRVKGEQRLRTVCDLHSEGYRLFEEKRPQESDEEDPKPDGPTYPEE
jgi:hypothetical protein